MAATGRRETGDEIEITSAMLDAGEDAILSEVGGAPLGGFFSARDLAKQVYEAMESHRGPIPDLHARHTR
jgi:hypothetical protein